jgi:hypothetical protein
MRDEILALLPRPSAALDRGAQRSGVWDSNPRPSYRREIYLHISGPTWGDVVPCSVRHSLSKPRDLHAFASKVGATARNVEAAMAVGFSRALISGQWVWRDCPAQVKLHECRSV